MKATWVCLSCGEKHQGDILFRCVLCQQQICPTCEMDHLLEHKLEFDTREDHLGHLGHGQE